MSCKGKFCFWLRLCIVLPLSDKANTWLGFIVQVGEGAGGGVLAAGKSSGSTSKKFLFSKLY